MAEGQRLPSAEGGPQTRRAHPHSPKTLDRRELLIATTTLAVALGLPGASLAQTGQPLTAIEFGSISSAIGGFPPADPNLAAEFLAAFADQTADLVRLHEIIQTSDEAEWPAQIDAAGLTPLAEALATAWYTGMVGQGADQRVVTYLNAFAWYAVGYTKPPTRCDISFGAWSAPPREVR